MSFDALRFRKDFPLLQQTVHGKPLAFLDSAASAAKPNHVIDVVSSFYRRDYANVHRGVHELSLRATRALEEARARIARFIGASDSSEIVFVLNSTEALNLVARSFGAASAPATRCSSPRWTPLEHRALADAVRAPPGAAPGGADRRARRAAHGRLRAAADGAHAAVALSHVSNVLGTLNPVEEIARLCAARGASLVVDGAQAVPHQPVDVAALAATSTPSAAQLFGPTGSACCGAPQLLEAMPPLMARRHDRVGDVRETTFAGVPARFERARPTSRASSGSRCHRVPEQIGMGAIERYERELLAYATERSRRAGAAPVRQRAAQGAVSPSRSGVQPPRLGTILDSEGRAVRAAPLRAAPDAAYGVPAMVRASLRSTTRAKTWTSWCARSRACARCSPDVGAARALPERDPRPQQEPAEPRAAGGRQSACRGPQPALRRSHRGVRARGRRPRRGRRLRGRRLRHLHRLGFADDGGGARPLRREFKPIYEDFHRLVTSDPSASPRSASSAVRLRGVREFRCASIRALAARAARRARRRRPVSTE